MYAAASTMAHFSERVKGLIDLTSVWHALLASHHGAYHPEKHYMRGPGPKCREKLARLSGVTTR